MLRVIPVASALGAEITGIDLAAALNDGAAGAVRAAFLEHKVIFIRDQNLSPQQFLHFSRLFGEPDIYPFIAGLPELPQVTAIIKTENDTVNFGGSWHSDTSYMELPARCTLLHALQVPDAGGDTLFANTALAYDRLSDGMKAMLAGLVGINSSEKRYRGGRAAGMARLDAMKGAFNPAAQAAETAHPVVRTHPETGRKSLYLNDSHTVRFCGMSEAESVPIIAWLCDHMTRPEHTCRLRWRPGTVAVWDNRTTLHHAVNDYAGKRRHMHRITIKGDRPC